MTFEVKLGGNDENYLCLPLNEVLRKFDKDPEKSYEALKHYIDVYKYEIPDEITAAFLSYAPVSMITLEAESRSFEEADEIREGINSTFGALGAACVSGLIEMIGIDNVLDQLDEYFTKEISEAHFSDIMRRYDNAGH